MQLPFQQMQLPFAAEKVAFGAVHVPRRALKPQATRRQAVARREQVDIDPVPLFSYVLHGFTGEIRDPSLRSG